MTSEPPQDGRPEGRPPSHRNTRRLDEGDLWADQPGSPSPPQPSRPPAARRATPPQAPQATGRPAQPRAPRRATPPAQAALPADETPALAVEDPYEEEDLYEYEEEESPSFLSNPYVLAALAVFGAILLAVVVVFVFGRNGGDSGQQGVTPRPTRTPTATAEASSPSATGLAAKSIAIATVREGPALTHLELGTLPAGQDVDIVGRNEDASWFQIVFPAGTQLTGWVPNSALRVPDNVEALVEVTDATPVSRPEVPTPTTAPVIEETPTPAVTETVTVTPEAGDGPDIGVYIASDCTPGSDLVIVITNVGSEELTAAPIEVTIANDGEAVYKQSFEARMPVGASAPPLNTGIEAEPGQIVVQVALTDRDDVDASNNIAGCTVASTGNVPPAIATQAN